MRITYGGNLEHVLTRHRTRLARKRETVLRAMAGSNWDGLQVLRHPRRTPVATPLTTWSETSPSGIQHSTFDNIVPSLLPLFVNFVANYIAANCFVNFVANYVDSPEVRPFDAGYDKDYDVVRGAK